MTRLAQNFRAFLREDKPFLGLYSWGWVIALGVIGFALVLIFGPPAWLAAVVWRLFSALVTGAGIIAALFVLVMALIVKCGFGK